MPEHPLPACGNPHCTGCPPEPPSDGLAAVLARLSEALQQPMRPAESHTQPPADPGPHSDTPQRCATCSTPIVHRGGERYVHLTDGYDDDTGRHPARPAEQHPDTPPHASGIPGLLDACRRVWLQAGDPHRWRLGVAQGWWTVEAIEEDAGGPVREVLLVDPAAWEHRERVIETVQRWSTAYHASADGAGEWSEIEAQYARANLDLAAAVDALTGGQPRDDWQRRSIGGPDHDGLTGRPLAPLHVTDDERAAWLAEVERPEPAGDGPGWQRHVIEAAISVARAVPSGQVNLPGAHIEGLLAERDERERERDHAAAALARAAVDMAQIQIERDWLQSQLGEHMAAVNRLIAERDRYRDSLPVEAQDYWHWRSETERLQAALTTHRLAYDQLRAEYDRELETEPPGAEEIREAVEAARRDAVADIDRLQGELAEQAGRADTAEIALADTKGSLTEVTAQRDHWRQTAEDRLTGLDTARRDTAAATLREAAKIEHARFAPGSPAVDLLRMAAEIQDGKRDVPGSQETP